MQSIGEHSVSERIGKKTAFPAAGDPRQGHRRLPELVRADAEVRERVPDRLLHQDGRQERADRGERPEGRTGHRRIRQGEWVHFLPFKRWGLTRCIPSV